MVNLKPSVYLFKGHVSLKYTKVRPLELINVPSEYPLETEDLSWKAQLKSVSLEKHTWETCCEEEKLNIHEQPGFEEVIPLSFPEVSLGSPAVP